ncbi:ImmA/IrrE family metallo-endopeptidase [Aeromicrobium piscarium]|uniref:IrrE N-terminal-like domain-containing protein n=1 Tax=Aeromicrobium piscarium TaxID=2590901 RepID=A0A554SP00_9ACTN|nr:ImmA/IrrE family metallo-endopeptidase [Aeromicrobium piscarium]TSD68084.1 hypothetical protein FNM00_00370 [Aeromicrobium piscarium]
MDDLPDGKLGDTCHISRTIKLKKGMRQRQRRAVLFHELIHLRRGGVEDDDELEAKEERVVEREVAEGFMPTESLIEALLWSQDEYELAEWFHIDVHTVRDRLRLMSYAERCFIDEEVDRREARMP